LELLREKEMREMRPKTWKIIFNVGHSGASKGPWRWICVAFWVAAVLPLLKCAPLAHPGWIFKIPEYLDSAVITPPPFPILLFGTPRCLKAADYCDFL
jgi:hypothetical protein